MRKELEAFERYHTLTSEPLPSEKKPIGSRRVYKIKYHSDGSIARYTALLVAKFYT